ncbi:ester cyclase [Zeaxanthinibacter sp. PT1]|uniref:ester cyclase n=1 Tax=Zeaxanthinibacter TaxID=561554 RepID=UPI00234B7C83|nr:ester cyclase [Zeaxanthinibacter sp. PT1]MDC6352252.1 ester cyclase [Zeaxanthinibacter sp. PT1]
MKLSKGLTIWIGCLLYSCGLGENTQQRLGTEQQQDSIIQEVIYAYVNHGWNLRNTLVLDELASPAFNRRMNGVCVTSNPKEMQSHMKVFFRGFPDLKITVSGVNGSGRDRVVEWNAEGTNTGMFGETAATGKKIKVSGISWILFDSNGKMAEEQVYYNELELLQQLGYTLIPPILD